MMFFQDRQFRLARLWSNSELKKFAPLFKGDIVNVSGWDDRDKQGGYYQEYFTNKTNYFLTNYSGYRGYQNQNNEYELDLSGELPEELVNRFAVVFNHTTLEHIFDVKKAFANLCRLSHDIVILVVPFSQVQHESPSYKDYWRFTPSCLHILFEENQFELLYINNNEHKNAAIYLFCIASRIPNKWKSQIHQEGFGRNVGETIGISPLKSIFKGLKGPR